MCSPCVPTMKLRLWTAEGCEAADGQDATPGGPPISECGVMLGSEGVFLGIQLLLLKTAITSANVIYWAHMLDPPLFTALIQWLFNPKDSPLASNDSIYTGRIWIPLTAGCLNSGTVSRNKTLILLNESPLFCLIVHHHHTSCVSIKS